MPSPEEYRRQAKEVRTQAKACSHDWERQGLLIIADQCERLAAYKDLTARETAPAQVKPHGRRTVEPADGSANGQQASNLLGAKVLRDLGGERVTTAQ
jgi:hypothetical protein